MKNTKKRSLIQYTWQLKRALVTAFAAVFAESSMYECAEICCDQKNKTLTNLGEFMNFNWKLFRLPSPQIPTKTHEISHKPHGHNYMGQPNIWSVIHSHLCTVVKILWQKCVVNLSLGFLLTANQPASHPVAYQNICGILWQLSIAVVGNFLRLLWIWIWIWHPPMSN